jgi:hypothetical protein
VERLDAPLCETVHSTASGPSGPTGFTVVCANNCAAPDFSIGPKSFGHEEINGRSDDEQDEDDFHGQPISSSCS